MTTICALIMPSLLNVNTSVALGSLWCDVTLKLHSNFPSKLRKFHWENEYSKDNRILVVIQKIVNWSQKEVENISEPIPTVFVLLHLKWHQMTMVNRKQSTHYLCAPPFRGHLFARKVVSWKLLFKFSCVCLSLWKLVNGKQFPVRKIWFDFRESIFLLFWAENTFQKLWKI